MYEHNMKNKILILAIIIVCALAFSQSALAQLRTLTPSQGGTGLGSATVSDVGNCLKVSDDSPFAYTLGTCGVGGATSTNPFMATYFVATSSSATSTLHAINSSHIQSQSSAGFNLYSSSNSLIGTFGAGGGTNSTLNGGLNVLGLLTIPRLNSTSTAASYFNGNLGIGSTTPFSELSISVPNAGNVNDGLTIDRGNGTNALGFRLKSDASGNFRGAITYKNATVSEVEAITIGQNSGNTNIGIATVTPSSILHAYGTSRSAIVTVENTGNGNTSGIDFIRQRSSGAGVNGGSIFMNSDTSGTNGLLYIQAQSANAQAGLTSSLVAGNGVRMVLRGGTGELSIENGATESARFSPTGNLGIGTTSPYSKLSVVGNIVSDSFNATSTTATSTVSNALGVQNFFYVGPYLYSGAYSNFTNAFARDYFIADFVKDSNNYTSVNFANMNSGSSASIDLTFNNSNTRDSNGDLEYENYSDIGRNSPTYNVPAFGVINVPNSFYQYEKDGAFIVGTATSSSAGYFEIFTGGFSNSRMRITSTGNVGIGTTTPAAKLTVDGLTTIRGGANAQFRIGAFDGSGEAVLTTYNDSLSSFVPMRFYSSEFNFLTGNVSIGTTTNFGTLNVKSGTDKHVILGTLGALTTGMNVLHLDYDETSNYGYLQSRTANVAFRNFVINPSGGNVGIGTTTPESLLDVDGMGTFGTESASTAQLLVKGGASGGSMITLRRTSGATSQFSWLLAGGGLTFADDTNGFNVVNIFGDSSQNQLYLGQRGKTLSDTRVNLLSATTFSSSAGTDVPGTELRLQSGLGTGAGTPGDLTFYTGNTGSSGSTAQSSSVRATLKGNTGFLGIGTTTPAGLINIASTQPQLWTSDTNSSVNAKHFVMQNSNGIFTFNSATDALTVSTTPTLAMNMQNGRVGIGTNPTTDFHLARTGTQAEALVETLVSGLASFAFRGFSSGTTHTTAGQGAAVIEMRDKSGTDNGFSSITSQDDGGSVLSSIAFVNDSPINNIGSMKFNTRASGGGLSTKMTLTSTGYLAIGTTTAHAGAVTIRETSIPSIHLVGSGTDGSGMFITDIDEGNNTNEGVISSGAQPAYSGGAITSWTARSTSASGYYFDNGDTQIFGNASLTNGNTFTPTTRIFVNGTNGRIGISTTTPSGMLHVTSDTSNTANALVVASASSGNRTLWLEGSQINARLTNQNTVSTAAHISMQADTGAGFVGVGTTTPVAKLQVAQADSQYQLGISGTTRGLRIETNSTATVLRGVDPTLFTSFQPLTIAGSDVRFEYNGSTSGMILANSGNVGIGTTSPLTLLHLEASAPVLTFYATNNASGARFQSTQGSAPSTANAFRFQGTNGATELMSITYAGNVGIGTTTPQSTLSVGSVGDSTASYMQIDNNAGAPTAGDCDSDMERGRQILDSTNHRLYVCNGATRGWDYVALTD